MTQDTSPDLDYDNRVFERRVQLPIAAASHIRADAARNRSLLLDVARRLIADLGADAVSMKDIAAVAGVGKGTLFRRFGSRAGLLMTLIDEDEMAAQQAYLFGPPPLGPGAPPLQRLLAFGRARLRFVQIHLPLLLSTNHDPREGDSGSDMLRRTHVRVLLETAGSKGNLRAQADALIGLLDARYIARQLHDGQTVDTLVDIWDDVARKLCGT